MPNAPLLQIKELTCIRNDKLLLNQLNFVLFEGEILQIQGVNGSGKSTLLQLLAGILLPLQGSIHWQNEPIIGNSYYYHQLHYMGHKTGVKSDLTVEENLRLAFSLADIKTQLRWEAIISAFSLDSLRNLPCESLSAGQKQRVALTRLLLMKRKLWILDEPYTFLDQKNAQVLDRLIAEQVNTEGMVILTSHQPLNLRNCRYLWL